MEDFKEEVRFDESCLEKIRSEKRGMPPGR